MVTPVSLVTVCYHTELLRCYWLYSSCVHYSFLTFILELEACPGHMSIWINVIMICPADTTTWICMYTGRLRNLWDSCCMNNPVSLVVWNILSGLQMALLFWAPGTTNLVSHPLLLKAGLAPWNGIWERRQTDIAQAPWKYRIMVT